MDKLRHGSRLSIGVRARCSFLPLATSLLLVWTHTPSSQAGETQTEVFPALSSLKDLVLPIGKDSSRPVIRLELAEIRTERKSVGFLKLGLIPQVVAEGLCLRIERSQRPSIWAAEFAEFLAAQPALASALVNGFEIRVRGSDAAISSAKAEFRNLPWRIELRDITARSPGMPRLPAASGTIYLEGAKAGYLSLTEGHYKAIGIDCDSLKPSPN